MQHIISSEANRRTIIMKFLSLYKTRISFIVSAVEGLYPEPVDSSIWPPAITAFKFLLQR
jgi:hypothetical protein